MIGQIFLYLIVKEFGAFKLALVMTTRQMVSMVLSTLFFGHQLNNTQWGAAVVVFATLYYKLAQTPGKRQKQGRGNQLRIV